MHLIQIVPSAIDRTKKYVFSIRDQIVEFSYIDKQDGKDIICTPSQTSCKLGCSFCFLTRQDNPVANLTAAEILTGIDRIVKDQFYGNRTLLVSFMGAGEPLNNQAEIFSAMHQILQLNPKQQNIRFAAATLMPSVSQMQSFTQRVVKEKLPVKLHLSLHSPFDAERKKLMPASITVEISIALLKAYQEQTGNPIEVHYTLMHHVNDTERHQHALVKLLGAEIPIQLLTFKEGAADNLKRSEHIETFRLALESVGVPVEVYDPPGGDIGSSCGQFLFENPATLNLRPLNPRSLEILRD